MEEIHIEKVLEALNIHGETYYKCQDNNFNNGIEYLRTYDTETKMKVRLCFSQTENDSLDNFLQMFYDIANKQIETGLY